MNQYTIQEVSKHNIKTDCWIIIKNIIYDITDFLSLHPGGSSIMLQVAGKDATEYFEELHRPEILKNYGIKYIIGELALANL